MKRPVGLRPQICVGCGKPNVPTGYLPSWANRADSHDGVGAMGFVGITVVENLYFLGSRFSPKIIF
jgi:hypothetical protein